MSERPNATGKPGADDPSPVTPPGKRGTFARLSAAAVFDPNVTPGALRVLAAFASYVRPDGTCYPSVGKVADRLGISPRAVQLHMGTLIEAGYLKREGQFRNAGRFASNGYTLQYPAETEAHRAKPSFRRKPDYRRKPSFAHRAKPSFTQTDHLTDGDGDGASRLSPAAAPSCAAPFEIEGAFDRFLNIEGVKVDYPDKLRLAWGKALRAGVSPETLIAGMREHIEGTPAKFIEQSHNWLNRRGWINPVRHRTKAPSPHPVGRAARSADLASRVFEAVRLAHDEK